MAWPLLGLLVATVAGMARGSDQGTEAHVSGIDTASARFDCGLFVAFGHVVEPPLVFMLSGDTLRLNGRYQLLPPEPPPPAPPMSPPSPRIVATQELLDRVSEHCRDLFLAGKSRSEVMDAAETLLQASPLVAGAEQIGDNSIWIQFHAPERPGGLFDIRMEGIGPPRFGPQPRPDFARKQLDELSIVLGRCGAVMYRKFGNTTSVPPSYTSAIRECIAGLRASGVPFPDTTECGKLLATFQADILDPRPLPRAP